MARLSPLLDLLEPYRGQNLEAYFQIVLPLHDQTTDDILFSVYKNWFLNWEYSSDNKPIGINYCRIPVVFRNGIETPLVEVRLPDNPLPFDE